MPYYTDRYEGTTRVWNCWIGDGTSGSVGVSCDVANSTTTNANDLVWCRWQPIVTTDSGTAVTEITAKITVNTPVWAVWTGTSVHETTQLDEVTRERLTLGEYEIYNPAPVLTPEQIEANRRAAAEARLEAARKATTLSAIREAEAERIERERKEREAEKRATRLLLSLLNRRQRAEYRILSQITIYRKGTRKPQYVLSSKWSGNITEYNEMGKPAVRHCVHPVGVPLPDSLATQFLYLNSRADELLRVANHTQLQVQ